MFVLRPSRDKNIISIKKDIKNVRKSSSFHKIFCYALCIVFNIKLKFFFFCLRLQCTLNFKKSDRSRMGERKKIENTENEKTRRKF
jgi:hypothetical protein